MNVNAPAVAVLTVAGDQVPVNPLLDVPGSVGAAEPWQREAIAVNVGNVPAVTVMHCGLVYVQPKLSVMEYVKQLDPIVVGAATAVVAVPPESAGLATHPCEAIVGVKDPTDGGMERLKSQLKM